MSLLRNFEIRVTRVLRLDRRQEIHKPSEYRSSLTGRQWSSVRVRFFPTGGYPADKAPTRRPWNFREWNKDIFTLETETKTQPKNERGKKRESLTNDAWEWVARNQTCFTSENSLILQSECTWQVLLENNGWKHINGIWSFPNVGSSPTKAFNVRISNISRE